VVESLFRRIGVCSWLDRPFGSDQGATEWLTEAEENEGPGIWIKGEPEPAEPFRALAAAVDLVSYGNAAAAGAACGRDRDAVNDAQGARRASGVARPTFSPGAWAVSSWSGVAAQLLRRFSASSGLEPGSAV
jgi:hypothetical protein